jgi:hypothetical protein
VTLRRVGIEGWGTVAELAVERDQIFAVQPVLQVERGELTALLGGHHQGGAAEAAGGGGTGRHVVVHEGQLALHDAKTGTEVQIGHLDCDVRGRSGTLVLRDLDTRTRFGASLRAHRVEVQLKDGVPFAVAASGGELALWKGLALTGIEGTVLPQVALTGSYGGVAERLWQATGTIDAAARRADVTIDAERFTLDKLAPILPAESLLLSPKKATVSGRIDVTARKDRIDVAGELRLSGLDIGSRALGQKAVRDLAFTAKLRGSADLLSRRLELTELEVDHNAVRAILSGSVDGSGPRPVVEARFTVPPVGCQTLLDALPRPLVPAIAGFRLDGRFALDLRTKIDWNELEALELGGTVGIDGCRVLDAPPDVSAKRLLASFDHRAEIEPGHEVDFAVGPSNPDFVPFPRISPHIVNSLMTTEDSGFFKHRGFITREFRSALVQNLSRGYFRLGASSITMQMVKNVLLSREKTLSRKLQEMFLTWYLEQNLRKERIFEIYLNVIEFGPGIYGIGRAMRHYFGKAAADATPREAAFFSSILPNPKRRYVHYCRGQLTEKWEQYLNRILRRMHERDRLTDDEFREATSHPLLFDRTEARPERECMEIVKRFSRTTPVDTEFDLKEPN